VGNYETLNFSVANMVDESIKKGNAHSKFKNEVLLGAFIKFARRIEQLCQDEKTCICVCGEYVVNVQ